MTQTQFCTFGVRSSRGGFAGRNMVSIMVAQSLSIIVLSASLSCHRVERPEAAPASFPSLRDKSGIEMVALPAGRFTLGSDQGDPDQAPAHEVSVAAFLIDRYEMTQAAYTKLGPVNGAHFKGPQRPVEMISWADAAVFCNVRSRAEGLEPCYDEETGQCDLQAGGYRLPTEAEWEYACRAGSQTDFSFGSAPDQLDRYAWYQANAGKTTHPVGQKRPNAWGLFDMHGNVAEWCNDVYAPDYYARSATDNPRGPTEGEKYVLRGGAWNSTAAACQSAARIGEDPGFQDACFARDAIGFRCVRRAP